MKTKVLTGSCDKFGYIKLGVFFYQLGKMVDHWISVSYMNACKGTKVIPVINVPVSTYDWVVNSVMFTSSDILTHQASTVVSSAEAHI